MKCLACGVEVLELRGPSGRGLIVEPAADGGLAHLAGRLRRIVIEGAPEPDGPYITARAAQGLQRFTEHASRCSHSIRPKTVSERTTAPIRLVGRDRNRGR